MKNRNHGLSEKEMELVKLLMADCESTGDIQAKLKRLFAGTIEQMLEAEMDEHLGYEKNSVLGNNSGNSRCQRNLDTVDDRLLVKQLRENRLIILKCETCSTIRLKTLHDHCDQRYNFIEHSHNQEWNQGK